MTTGNLVWLMKGAPLYEAPSASIGVATRHYTGHITAMTMGVEMQRIEVNDYEHQGQREARLVSWSQVLVNGQLSWTRTRLLELASDAGDRL